MVLKIKKTKKKLVEVLGLKMREEKQQLSGSSEFIKRFVQFTSSVVICSNYGRLNE